MFCIDGRDLARLPDYTSAAAYFARTKPFRNDEGVPLANRRRTHMALIKEADDSYHARLYRTTLVKYHADGRIWLREYNTNSSRIFINEVSLFNIRRSYGAMYVQHNGNFYRLDNERGTLTFKDGVCLDPMPTLNRAVNRERSKAVREKLKPFLKHRAAVMKLLNGSPLPKIDFIHYADRFVAMENEDNWPHLLGYFVGATNGLIRQHAYEHFNVFDKVPVPYTVMPSYPVR